MLYFVRHGQTEWNALYKLQGHTDIPLNENGISQAEKTAEILKDKSIDIIFSSDLSRAYDTALIINKYHNAPVISDKRIRERGFGVYEGNDMATVDFNAIMDYDKNLTVEGGETARECYNRIKEFLDCAREAYRDKNLLLVAHGGISIYIKKYFNRLGDYPDLFSAISGNCMVDTFEF